MIATRTVHRRLLGAAAVMLTVVLVLPATSQGARPNPGKWDTDNWNRDLSFVVKGKKKARIANFNPNWRTNWTCPDTGEEVWTQVSGLAARVTGGGAFNSTATTMITSLNRLLTVNLNGRFGSRTRASGTLTWSLEGCGSQVETWGAYGPATKRKGKKKKGGGGGGGDGGGGDPGQACIPIPLPDGSGWICV